MKLRTLKNQMRMSLSLSLTRSLKQNFLKETLYRMNSGKHTHMISLFIFIFSVFRMYNHTHHQQFVVRALALVC